MNAIVAEARRWIGTPYVHQASARGAGTDCLGLIRGIWRSLHQSEPEALPPYSADWAEAQGLEVLWSAALRHLRPVDHLHWEVGQVLLFRMQSRAVAKHLGVLTACGPAAQFVHAYTKHGVVESPLSDPWARKIVARFAFQEG